MKNFLYKFSFYCEYEKLLQSNLALKKNAKKSYNRTTYASGIILPRHAIKMQKKIITRKKIQEIVEIRFTASNGTDRLCLE
jgi:hypothetical protein